MNENIDLTKILKNCPKDAVFYSSIYGDVTVCVHNLEDYPISIYKQSDNIIDFLCRLTKEGKYNKQFKGECTLFPSKEQRDWSKFTAPWYKKKKFDPNTLQPFDKVLVRLKLDKDYIWIANIFSYYDDDLYYTISGRFYKYCIPYNDDTKHLVGTTDEAPKYYRYWE